MPGQSVEHADGALVNSFAPVGRTQDPLRTLQRVGSGKSLARFQGNPDSESKTTSNAMILVPLLNPKFAIGFAARGARTSGSGH
jgi:hypothetical protein